MEKKILVDLVSVKNSKSIYLYAQRLLRELSVLNLKVSVLVPLEKSADYSGKFFNAELIKYPLDNCLIQKMPYLRGFYRRFKLLRFIKKLDFDVVYFPSANALNDFRLPMKKVVTIHDLRPIKRSGKSNRSTMDFFCDIRAIILKSFFKRHLLNADRIIAISNYTKNDIVNFFPFVNTDNVIVVYNSIHLADKSKSIDCINSPYILYVNTLVKYKNILTLVYAFYDILDKYSDVNLVVVGRKTSYWNTKVKKVISDLKIERRIIHIEYCSDEELKWLYENALVFVSPSTREGFGYTPIEAAICKSPVITTLSESLPEVTCGMTFYYDPPHSVNELARILDMVLSSPPSKDYLENISSYFRCRYSPDKQAESIYAILSL